MTENYICINGTYFKTGKSPLNLLNRSFHYGDGIFETIHANGTEPQFIERHMERMMESMRLLRMNIPDFYSTDNFTRFVKGLLTRNKQFRGARIRITVFRNNDGLYTPEGNDVTFVMESTELEQDTYILNKQGYRIEVFPDILKPVNALSSIKTTSALLYVMAGIFRLENGWDECIILNQQKKICESISSNIFLQKEDKFYTPSLAEGCLPGIMRQVIIECIRQEKFFVEDMCSLTPEDLLLADELFLTNTITGIRWIVAFRQRRYYNKSSKLLIDKLNKKAFRS